MVFPWKTLGSRWCAFGASSAGAAQSRRGDACRPDELCFRRNTLQQRPAHPGCNRSPEANATPLRRRSRSDIAV